jgi:ABC-type lipopolysaccharide export system ATPase subunit
MNRFAGIRPYCSRRYTAIVARLKYRNWDTYTDHNVTETLSIATEHTFDRRKDILNMALLKIGGR